MGKSKIYQYNGKGYTCSEYSKLISEKTGQDIVWLKNRIRKGWSIEKLMFPNTVKKPICQYTIDGEFVKKYNSIGEAVRLIRRTTASAIKRSAQMTNTKIGGNTTSGGFIWRYADEITDTTEKINNVKPYNSDEDRKYLRDKYTAIMEWCYSPTGIYFDDAKIKVWEGWKNDFEVFYNDLLPLLKNAKLKYKTYKRRMKRGVKFENASDDLKVTHIWFTRIDKTEGYLPANVCFTTPDWTMRYRPNSHRVIIDNEIKFIPEIYDELTNQEKEAISEATIRENVVVNNPILHTADTKHYQYNGKLYTRRQVCSMLNIPEERLTRYLQRFGDNAVQKALDYKEPTKIIFENKEYRIFELVDEIKLKSTTLSEEKITGRVRHLKEKKNEFTAKDIRNILETPQTEIPYIVYKDEKRKLIDVCKENNFSYSVAWKRYKRGWTIDELFNPVNKLPFGREIEIIKHDGNEYSIKDIADKLGVTVGTIYYRIKQGWSNERIFAK